MNHSHKNEMSLLKRALYTIKKLKEAASFKSSQPIAVIGMSCRFASGCDTPEKFWEFLKAGKDGIKEIPKDRFNVDDYFDSDPNQPGKIYVREAGFLSEDISAFDARFFGISPREAEDLDPQQRLLLELSWEALERAGISPHQVNGSLTGVFIGLILGDYGYIPRSDQSIGPYTVTGKLPNIASGRISHFLGLQGPAITVDTACSSSLVSVHLACESLQNNECDMALAGGINLMIIPSSFIMLCKVKALAKDGRCKTFDISADGYGRGEGGGIIVLKRLSDAIRDKDNILAVIKGSSVNQDGHSSGLTVPNGIAQRMLIKKTLSKAKINPEDVGYFETHGTGTALGDPIEIQAITEIFGQKPRNAPLILGSVKANIGHLEAAAGIAAIIKCILCLQHKMIPPHLHLKTLNPRIHLEKIPAIVPKSEMLWDSEDKPKILGISSFGFSGTNAHTILSEAFMYDMYQKELSETSDMNDLYSILALSARDKNALNALAKKYLLYLTENNADENLANICYTTNTGRAAFSYRLAFLSKNKHELQEEINHYLQNNLKKNFVFQSEELTSPHKIAFLFFGENISNLAQYLFLYDRYTVFKNAMVQLLRILLLAYLISLLSYLEGTLQLILSSLFVMLQT